MDPNLSKYPTLAIAIPAYNEERNIVSVLESIVNNGYPVGRIRIYIADAGSSDRTVHYSEEYLKRNGIDCSVLFNRKKLPACGLNLILSVAVEDVFVRCDAHSIYEANYLTSLVALLQEKSGRGLVTAGGCLKTVENGACSLVARVISRVIKSIWTVGPVSYRLCSDAGGPVRVDTAPFSIFWRNDLTEIGGYDESLPYAEDDELNFRVLRYGGEVWLNPEAVFHYSARETLRKLARQYFSYGHGKAGVFHKHGNIASIRQVVPLLHVVLSLLSLAGSIYYLPLLLYFVPYAIFLVVATVAINKSNPVLNHIITIAAISVVQYSYGFGYLYGVLRWFLFSKQNRSVS